MYTDTALAFEGVKKNRLLDLGRACYGRDPRTNLRLN